MPLGRGHFHHYDIGLLLLLLGIVKGNLVFLQIKIINFLKKNDWHIQNKCHLL
jgi:hypothetical protein